MNSTFRVLLISLVTTASALSPAFPAEQPVWRLIEPLFQAEQANPSVPRAEDGTGHLEAHRFLFEEFAALGTEDFLAGLNFILQKYPPPADRAKLPAYERDMGHKLRILFEYYPLAARSPKDFELLANLVFDAGKPLPVRAYVLRQMGPGLDPPSALGSYAQGHMEHGDGKVEARLRELALLPQERPSIRIHALAVLLALVDHGYAVLLKQDPLVAALPAEEAPHVRQLIGDNEAIALSRRTQILLERKNTAVGTWARSSKAMANSDQQRPEVREKAREVLDAILRDYPVAGRDALLE